MIKPAAGYPPLAYSSPKAVQTTGTVAEIAPTASIKSTPMAPMSARSSLCSPSRRIGRLQIFRRAGKWRRPTSFRWSVTTERPERAVAALTKELLDLAAPQPGERVLDIGCGPGTTVLELAKHVGPGGHVLGADVSEPSVVRARERIAAAGLRHAEVIVADASVHPFPPDNFELTFSRFGIMFFSDPVAAFANVRRAMKPGGRLTLAVL